MVCVFSPFCKNCFLSGKTFCTSQCHEEHNMYKDALEFTIAYKRPGEA